MENRSTAIENLARTQARARLSSTGTLFSMMQELSHIEQDTSPEIRQLCIAFRQQFDIFQNRAKADAGANYPQMLIELNEFEARCRQTLEQHSALIHEFQRLSRRFWEDLLRLKLEIKAYADRRPRIEYDVSETSSKLESIVAFPSPTTDSYAELHAFVEQAQLVLAIARKDVAQLTHLWQNFVTAQSQSTKALLDMQSALDRYQLWGQTNWVWIRNASQKVLAPIYDRYKKCNREFKQVTGLDINLNQAIGICQRIEQEIRLDLRTVISKLESIQEQQEQLRNMFDELEHIAHRTTIFSITPKHSDLIRQFCALAIQAETFASAKMNLELAQKVLERSITQEDAVQIIQNYDLKIENRNIGQNRVPGTQSADVFISYARTDIEVVQDLYSMLLDSNHQPWMDVHSIKGGENWLHAITRAIDECEIFLTILSNNSVSRRGVLQKELRKALDRWEEMLPDDIYIIPVRIDDCPIPGELKRIHVLDWNHGRGKDKLLEAIRTGLARRDKGKAVAP